MASALAARGVTQQEPALRGHGIVQVKPTLKRALTDVKAADVAARRDAPGHTAEWGPSPGLRRLSAVFTRG